MIKQKKIALKGNLAGSHRHITSSNPHLPTHTQTEAVFKIVKRSILKNAKKEGKNISALELRIQIHEMMKKWPKQNWPKLEKAIVKK